MKNQSTWRGKFAITFSITSVLLLTLMSSYSKDNDPSGVSAIFIILLLIFALSYTSGYFVERAYKTYLESNQGSTCDVTNVEWIDKLSFFLGIPAILLVVWAAVGGGKFDVSVFIGTQ